MASSLLVVQLLQRQLVSHAGQLLLPLPQMQALASSLLQLLLQLANNASQLMLQLLLLVLQKQAVANSLLVLLQRQASSSGHVLLLPQLLLWVQTQSSLGTWRPGWLRPQLVQYPEAPLLESRARTVPLQAQQHARHRLQQQLLVVVVVWVLQTVPSLGLGQLQMLPRSYQATWLHA